MQLLIPEWKHESISYLSNWPIPWSFKRKSYSTIWDMQISILHVCICFNQTTKMLLNSGFKLHFPHLAVLYIVSCILADSDVPWWWTERSSLYTDWEELIWRNFKKRWDWKIGEKKCWSSTTRQAFSGISRAHTIKHRHLDLGHLSGSKSPILTTTPVHLKHQNIEFIWKRISSTYENK